MASNGPNFDFESIALSAMRKANLRVTMPRIQVIRILAKADRPLSPYAIHEAILAEGGRIDVVSVYRILAAMQELDLVHHIGSVDGYQACGMDGHAEGETEHLICTSCGRVTEAHVPYATSEALQGQLKELNFVAEAIKVEVLGQCGTCTTQKQDSP